MKIIIACERSGRVREAFRRRGHDAWSCDIAPAEDGSTYHIQGDAIEAAYGQHWDAMIGHPMCTFLCLSSVHLLTCGRPQEANRWEEMKQAAEFFLKLWRAPIDRIALENPVMHGHAMKIIKVKYSQTIQPYNFGADASKRTALWLKKLPPLSNGLYVKPRMVCKTCGGHSTYDAAFGKGCTHCGAEAGLLQPRWANQTDGGQNKLPPSEHRARDRAVTYQGIADAMAKQWG
jgi:hypothetical protein